MPGKRLYALPFAGRSGRRGWRSPEHQVQGNQVSRVEYPSGEFHVKIADGLAPAEARGHAPQVIDLAYMFRGVSDYPGQNSPPRPGFAG